MALALVNERKPVVPVFTVTAETTLRWQGRTVTLPPGSHRVMDIELEPGVNLVEARTTSGTGEITAAYREGAL